jgi:hypothetical protein
VNSILSRSTILFDGSSSKVIDRIDNPCIPRRTFLLISRERRDFGSNMEFGTRRYLGRIVNLSSILSKRFFYELGRGNHDEISDILNMFYGIQSAFRINNKVNDLIFYEMIDRAPRFGAKILGSGPFSYLLALVGDDELETLNSVIKDTEVSIIELDIYDGGG